MIEPESEKEIKKMLKKITSEEVRELMMKNAKLAYKSIRGVFTSVSNRLATVEMAKFHEIISDEKFITLTKQMIWELKIMTWYFEEKLLAYQQTKDEIVDGMLMTWDYDREKKAWIMKEEGEKGDGAPSTEIITHILSEENLYQMLRRIFDSYISKIEAEKTHFHKYFKLITEEDDLIPGG